MKSLLFCLILIGISSKSYANVYGLVFGFDIKDFEPVLIMDCRQFKDPNDGKKELEKAVQFLESSGVKCTKNSDLVDWTCGNKSKVFSATLLRDLKKCKDKPANDAKKLKLLVGG